MASSQFPIPLLDDRDHISRLPDETKVRIVNHMYARDAANLRLVSKSWGGIAAEGLFNVTLPLQTNPQRFPAAKRMIQNGVLEIRPQFNDMDKIIAISKRPWLAMHVKEVKIYPGDVGDNFPATIASEGDGPRGRAAQRHARQFISSVKQYSSKHCRLETLSIAFSRLPNVDTLRVLSKELPFSKGDVELSEVFHKRGLGKPWHYTDLLQDMERAMPLYYNVLIAASQFKSPIKFLHLDAMPVELLIDKESNVRDAVCDTTAEHLKDSLFMVKDLRIGIALDLNLEDQEDFLEPTHQFLKFFPNLESLEVSWESERDSFRRWPAAVYSLLQGIHWPHLRRLRLQNFPLTQDTLTAVLMKHNHSLEALSIRECSFEYVDENNDDDDDANWHIDCVDPKIQTLLTLLRDKFSLKMFELMLSDCADGLVGCEWPQSPKLYDDDWEASPGNGPTGPDWEIISGVPPTDAKLIEQFVLGRCQWPMTNSHPSDWIRRSPWDFDLEAALSMYSSTHGHACRVRHTNNEGANFQVTFTDYEYCCLVYYEVDVLYGKMIDAGIDVSQVFTWSGFML